MPSPRFDRQVHSLFDSIDIEPFSQPAGAVSPVGQSTSGYLFTYGNENAPADQAALEVPIVLGGMPSGRLAVEAGEDSRAVVEGVANELAQRLVELLNIRKTAPDEASQPAEPLPDLNFHPEPRRFHYDPDQGVTQAEASAEKALVRSTLRVGGEKVGRLSLDGDHRHSSLLEAAAGVIGDRLEILYLEARLKNASADAAALRQRLDALNRKP